MEIDQKLSDRGLTHRGLVLRRFDGPLGKKQVSLFQGHLIFSIWSLLHPLGQSAIDRNRAESEQGSRNNREGLAHKAQSRDSGSQAIVEFSRRRHSARYLVSYLCNFLPLQIP